MRINIMFAVTGIILAFQISAIADDAPLHKIESKQRAKSVQRDSEAVCLYRSGMRDVVEYLGTQQELFVQDDSPRVLGRVCREELPRAWKRLLDYSLALDSIQQFHGDWFKLKSLKERKASFYVTRAAFQAQYRYALEFISLIEQDHDLDVLLNDPVPELGLPSGSYAEYKEKYLNVKRGTKFVAFNTAALFLRDEMNPLVDEISEDAAAIHKFGRGEGEKLTFLNALEILQDKSSAAWFPVQAGVAGWMGDTRVARADSALITPDQIAALAEKLQPGDIILTRREWYLSNIGLPGFWPHGALYIGTPEERLGYFDDPETLEWIRNQKKPTKDLEELLQDHAPEAYKLSRRPQEKNHLPRCLEAMSEGVVFTTLEHCAAADSLVILRPRLPKGIKAGAILRAFRYSGRPYDFNFDFRTDSALVCTELLYKAYEPLTSILPGLHLPVSQVLGRPVVSANDIVRQFDEQFGTPDQQFDFICFLDGNEAGLAAHFSTCDSFRQSWRRPKWHIFVQGKRAE